MWGVADKVDATGKHIIEITCVTWAFFQTGFACTTTAGSPPPPGSRRACFIGRKLLLVTAHDSLARMKLEVGLAVRNRLFSKAMRRILPLFDGLRSEFDGVELQHPLGRAILLGITDDLPAGHIEETPNNSGYHQFLCGLEFSQSFSPNNDIHLARAVFEQMRRAMALCQFADPDREAFERLFDRWAPFLFHEYA